LWVAGWRGIGDSAELQFEDVMMAVLMPVSLKKRRELMEKDEFHRCITNETASQEDVQLDFYNEAPVDSKAQEEEAEPLGMRAHIHLLLENPGSSKAAEIIWMLMGLLIMLSVFVMVVQPLVSSDAEANQSDVEKGVWTSLEIFFTAIFTVEYVVRLCIANALGTQTTLGFVVKPSNICDAVAVLPFYIELLIRSADGDGFMLLRIVRLLRLTRISRIAKLARRSPIFGPIAMVMVVIWFIYLTTLK